MNHSIFNMNKKIFYKKASDLISECMLNVSENTIRKYISNLIKKGFITNRSNPLYKWDRTTQYRVNMANVINTIKNIGYDGLSGWKLNNESTKLKNCVSKLENCGAIPEITTETTINNKEDKDKSFSKKDDLFEECWKTYKRKGSKSISQRYWKKLSETEKANVQKHIPYYIKSVDNIKYIKDFERYLRDKIFESVVYKNGSIIYDPERIIDDGIYHPMTDMFGVFWSDNTKCYISSNMLGTQMFQDGYTNENRPNNSIIMYQGTRFHWNSEIKRWEENK